MTADRIPPELLQVKLAWLEINAAGTFAISALVVLALLLLLKSYLGKR